MDTATHATPLADALRKRNAAAGRKGSRESKQRAAHASNAAQLNRLADEATKAGLLKGAKEYRRRAKEQEKLAQPQV